MRETKFSWTSFWVGLYVGAIVFMIGWGLIAQKIGYKNGQIDAINGKIEYSADTSKVVTYKRIPK